MDDVRPALAHDEGRLLDRIMAYRDDEIGLLDCLVDIVFFRESGGTHVELRSAGNRSLPHLRRKERDAGTDDELRDVRRRTRA